MRRSQSLTLRTALHVERANRALGGKSALHTMDAEALQDWMQRPSPKPQAKLGDDENIPSIYDPNVMAEAARSGDVEVVKILIQQKYIMSTAMRAAAQEGHIDVMRCLKEAECPWDERTCGGAARQGQLAALQWLHQAGCPWDESTCRAAAAGGHLSVLAWAHLNGAPWDEETCSAAAAGGFLDMIQWARTQGCPWDAFTCSAAARAGHLELLRWCLDHDAPSDEGDVLRAARGDHLEVLQLAVSRGCEWSLKAVQQAAEEMQAANVVEWLNSEQGQAAWEGSGFDGMVV